MVGGLAGWAAEVPLALAAAGGVTSAPAGAV